MNGVINFFKPRGMTSHDAVNLLRRTLKTKKIGHTGTLDPNASGVLPLCIGKGTRIAEYLLDSNKEYIGELTLGYRTDTQDGDGKVISSSNKLVTENEIISAMSKYIGDISQLPPMYSALKHKGKKLYELAREGKTVERTPRNIKIYSQNILNIEDCTKIIFHTSCSRGTYIRTLCDDIGMDLGTYGYMSYLLRVAAGNFKIENSYSIEYIQKLNYDEILQIITPMDKALEHIDRFVISDDLYFKLINGVVLHVDVDENMVNKLYRVYCKETFIGIGKIMLSDSKFYLKMEKVLMI
ncbi:tRNA pseudouridine(55) synthase TruB [Tissierella pigra]|uniref:tRNA pseudouridine synthase B n=1 Tax=Tissierella pigra TaxID=2607614 RepID=A0A6N7XD71_9FIRM|nr:tRNA pseudouridine(55) synthase TruB [Tissierella pigra]MBU5426576.1 tRNA pseudouridine(55) synthase TruB [Tissierella pigra]MST99978.1 tRNA pseudouridine(55) synthase TruB [Tissierella pigra]